VNLRCSRCARKCARSHLMSTPHQPTPANEIKENPSASLRLTEGLSLALKLRRPMLYPPELQAHQAFTRHQWALMWLVEVFSKCHRV